MDNNFTVSIMYTAACDVLISAMQTLSSKIYNSLTTKEVSRIEAAYRGVFPAYCSKFDAAGNTIEQVPALIQASLVYLVSGQPKVADEAVSQLGIAVGCPKDLKRLEKSHQLCQEILQVVQKYSIVSKQGIPDRVATVSGAREIVESNSL